MLVGKRLAPALNVVISPFNLLFLMAKEGMSIHVPALLKVAQASVGFSEEYPLPCLSAQCKMQVLA